MDVCNEGEFIAVVIVVVVVVVVIIALRKECGLLDSRLSPPRPISVHLVLASPICLFTPLSERLSSSLLNTTHSNDSINLANGLYDPENPFLNSTAKANLETPTTR